MQKPKNIPEDPGVYLYKDILGRVIYVGKAKNLKNRINSYFANDLLPKTAQMISSAQSVSFIKVRSEFEALLLEANLVKKYQPKFNIELKDDKSPLYIGITKENLPRIVTFRKPEMKNYKLKTYFGPYLSGISARGVLRKIRRIFPYSTHIPMKKICIYKQIGLCDPCPSEINGDEKLRKKYLKNIRGVKNILNGKLNIVEKELAKAIKEASGRQNFEEAQDLVKKLQTFQNLKEHQASNIEAYLENPNLIEDIHDKEKKDLEETLAKYLPGLNLTRIECFDIAHLSGIFPTASMVTFTAGEPDKKYYRHFKIYQKKKRSDVDSMREVIVRRLKHLNDWGRPDLIIIDGGKPQLSKVHDLLESENIPFIGLAKRYETIVVRTKDGEFHEKRALGPSLALIQRIRDEAHRFARRLHHHQIKKELTK